MDVEPEDSLDTKVDSEDSVVDSEVHQLELKLTQDMVDSEDSEDQELQDSDKPVDSMDSVVDSEVHQLELKLIQDMVDSEDSEVPEDADKPVDSVDSEVHQLEQVLKPVLELLIHTDQLSTITMTLSIQETITIMEPMETS